MRQGGGVETHMYGVVVNDRKNDEGLPGLWHATRDSYIIQIIGEDNDGFGL